jgi:hypothetical protein
MSGGNNFIPDYLCTRETIFKLEIRALSARTMFWAKKIKIK